MSTDPHAEHPADVSPRDPDPETAAGDAAPSSSGPGSESGSGSGSGAGEQDPSSPEAIANDPSTAGGPSDDVPDEVERLRGG